MAASSLVELVVGLHIYYVLNLKKRIASCKTKAVGRLIVLARDTGWLTKWGFIL